MTDNNKNIYDMLNDIEIDLNEYEREDFTDIEKMKLKKSFRKTIKENNNNNNKYKKYISAASVAVVTLGIVSQTRLGAYAYDAIENVVERMQIALGIEDGLYKYTSNVNQSVTKNGLTVKINEAVVDNNELIIYISHTYDGELKKDENVELISERLYVNGKEINEGAKGYYTKIDKNTNEQIIAYELGDKQYEGDINVKLKIWDAYIYNDKSPDEFKRINGPWIFKFKANGDELEKDTQYINIDKEIKMDNGDIIKIEDYRANILNKRINVSFEIHSGEDIDIVFKGKDNLGNRVDFIGESGSMEDGKYTYEFDKYNYTFNPDATKLYLTPYLITFEGVNGNQKVFYKKAGDGFDIDLTK